VLALGNCFEPAGMFHRTGMALRRLDVVLRPAGAVRFRPYQCFQSRLDRVLRLHLVCRNMVSDIASSLRVWFFSGDWPAPLLGNVGKGPRQSIRASGVRLSGALPYSHRAETRYELDEKGLRCSIALPLGMDGRQERL
jgi:hypothetical protein